MVFGTKVSYFFPYSLYPPGHFSVPHFRLFGWWCRQRGLQHCAASQCREASSRGGALSGTVASNTISTWATLGVGRAGGV